MLRVEESPICRRLEGAAVALGHSREGVEALHRSYGASGSKQVLWKCCQQFIIPTILLATGLSFGPSFQGSDFIPKAQVRTWRAKAGQAIGSFHSIPPSHGGGRRAGGYREGPASPARFVPHSPTRLHTYRPPLSTHQYHQLRALSFFHCLLWLGHETSPT